MKQQYHRKSHPKLCVLCFVAAQHHACIAAKAAADDGDAHEHGLRNAPNVRFGKNFIQRHGDETQRIDDEKVGHTNLPEVMILKKALVILVILLLSVTAGAEEPYCMIVGIPSHAEIAEKRENYAEYVHEKGDYFITVRRFPAENAKAAAKVLAGNCVCFADRYRRFGMEEYLLRWNRGGKRCRADILLDGAWCYAVVFEANTPKYDVLATEVFSTFGLYYDEGA